MISATDSDADLLGQARQGDGAAFTELYARHQPAAQRLAISYRRAGDPDDLVNEAFERVLGAIQRGAGPTETFRAYLFVTLRRIAAERISRTQEEPIPEVPEHIQARQADLDVDAIERHLVVRAYESLPEQSQMALWQSVVEGRRPRELAPLLGTSANAAAAIAYRSREKLRQAYLQAHLKAAPRPECEPHRSRLGAFVRNGLSPRHERATRAHIDKCASCRGLLGELVDVNGVLGAALFPIFVSSGEIGAAILGGAAGGAAAESASGPAGMSGLARRGLSKAHSNPGTLAGVAVATAAVAAAVGAAVIAFRPGDDAPPPDAAAREVEVVEPAEPDDRPGTSVAPTPTTEIADAPPAEEPPPANPDPPSTLSGSAEPASGPEVTPAPGSEPPPSVPTPEAQEAAPATPSTPEPPPPPAEPRPTPPVPPQSPASPTPLEPEISSDASQWREWEPPRWSPGSPWWTREWPRWLGEVERILERSLVPSEPRRESTQLGSTPDDLVRPDDSRTAGGGADRDRPPR